MFLYCPRSSKGLFLATRKRAKRVRVLRSCAKFLRGFRNGNQAIVWDSLSVVEFILGSARPSPSIRRKNKLYTVVVVVDSGSGSVVDVGNVKHYTKVKLK